MATKFPPPPPWKADAFFRNNSDDTGWSESYWVRAVDTAQEALAAIQDMMVLRLALLTPEMELNFVRVSDGNIRNDTLVKGFLPGDAKGTFPDSASPQRSLRADLGVLVRMENQFFRKHTTRLLRGIPRSIVNAALDSSIDTSLSTAPNGPLWQSSFDIWEQRLIDEYAIMVKNTDPDPVFTDFFIEAVSLFSDIRSRNIGRPSRASRGRRVAR